MNGTTFIINDSHTREKESNTDPVLQVLTQKYGLLGTALYFAKCGYSVIPVTMASGAKRPQVKWKQRQSTPATLPEIMSWSTQYRPRMWGVVTGPVSGLVILDFDGEQGAQLLKRWGLTPHVRTGSGGYHVYLVHPGWPVKTFNSKSPRPWNVVYAGLDVRGDGGFAVFAGRNDSGPYELLRPPTPDPLDSVPGEAREALGLLHPPVGEHRTVPPVGEHRTVPPVIPSEQRYPADRLVATALGMVESGQGRNNSCFWLMCQLRDSQYSPEEAQAAGRQFIEHVPETDTKGHISPFTGREMQARLESAYSYPARDPLVAGDHLIKEVDALTGGITYRPVVKAGLPRRQTQALPAPAARECVPLPPPTARSTRTGEEVR